MDRKKIIDAVKASGVVGAGGAGFPTHVKLASNVDHVIANGAECEPLLKVDQQLMLYFPEKVIKGLQFIAYATGASRATIALKAKYRDAAESLQAAIRKLHAQVELFYLGNYYPAGDEQDIVYDVTGRIVPEGGIPLNVGVVVDNIGTLINISDAMEGVPVTNRVLTVSGAVLNPITVSFPIGTAIKDVIALAGGPTIKDYMIIDGGPMMGKIVKDTGLPVTKTTSGILVIPGDRQFLKKKIRRYESDARRAKSICDQCYDCTAVCPRYLLGHSIEPHKVMRTFYIEPRMPRDESWYTMSYLCSQCGVCDYFACPTGLSPKNIFRDIRQKLAEAGIPNPHKMNIEQVRSVRSGRRVPVKRLIGRLGLTELDSPAKFDNVFFEPERVSIPLNQHIGAPSVPVVKQGSRVKKGDLIGESAGNISARVHASIDGRVIYVGSLIKIEKE